MTWTARAVTVAAALAAGCNAPGGAEDAGPGAETGPGEPAPQGGNPLGRLGMMSSLLSASAGEPGPYEPPKTSPGYADGDDHVAVLEVSGPLVELGGVNLFGGVTGVELRALTDRLRELAGDEHVSGLLVRQAGVDIGLAAAEELRSALAAFRTAGDRERELFCHADRASLVDYYVLTACDRVGLAPLGEVTIPGVSAAPVYIKGLLDKLGVEPQFLTVGDYKGAAEPLTRDQPSEEMKVTLRAVLDTAYETAVAGIAGGRELEPAKVRELIDGAVYQGKAAKQSGLVDDVATFSDFRASTLGGDPWRRVEVSERSSAPDLRQLMRFLGLSPPSRPSEPHVAVVYAVGNVVDGDGSAGPRSEIAPRPLGAALGVLAADDAVKSVVLRIDSGGGSALASELIWHAVSELAAKKPVVVSMGEVAASGGYYIAAPASRIYALENTLTGSIGVVGGKLTVDEALDTLGISIHPIARGDRALLGSLVTPWTEEDKEVVRDLMRGVYDRFVARVAEGRDMSRDAVLEVAGGRLWTGRAALERGLVDEIGGLDDALARARRLGGVDASAPLEVYPPDPTVMDVLSELGPVSAPGAARQAIVQLARQVGPREARAAGRLLDFALSIRESPVAAVALTAVALP